MIFKLCMKDGEVCDRDPSLTKCRYHRCENKNKCPHMYFKNRYMNDDNRE